MASRLDSYDHSGRFISAFMLGHVPVVWL